MKTKKIEQTSSFKKDIKKYRHTPNTLKALYAAICSLAHSEPLPKSMRPHILSGNYEGIWECHVENDSLLLWIEQNASEEEVITLLRFGSHSNLF